MNSPLRIYHLNVGNILWHTLNMHLFSFQCNIDLLKMVDNSCGLCIHNTTLLRQLRRQPTLFAAAAAYKTISLVVVNFPHFPRKSPIPRCIET